MFSAVFINGGISSQSSTFYAAAINHSHVSVLPDDEIEQQERETTQTWREAACGGDLRGSSGGGCAPHLETVGILFGSFFFHQVPVQACMPGLPLVAAFMDELMACKLPLRLQLSLRAAVKDLFSSISPVFTIQISCFGVFH